MARPLASPSSAGRVAAWTLGILTALNFLNYVDRYVLAAVLVKMKHDPAFASVSLAELGLLQTAFLWVYMLASPPVGLLGRRVPRKYLVAAGVGIWSLATVASGLVTSYGQMVWARALIGFGEAGYAVVAPAMISDLYAPDRRNRVLSIFYLATPVGSAMGFVIGGLVAEHWGWRSAFFVAGGPGLLFALVALLLPEPARGAQEGLDAAAGLPLREGLRAIARPAFLYITFGMTLMVFAVGGLAFWMPTYFQEVRKMTAEEAGLYFGGIAVIAGILGTLAGQLLGDSWEKRAPGGGYLRLSGLGLLAAAPFAFATPFIGWLPLCLLFAFIAELLIFLNTGPLNTALVNASPPGVRELAVGLNVLMIHLLGDAISPPLLGALADALKRRGYSPETASSVAVAATALPLLGGGWLLLRGAQSGLRDKKRRES